MAAPSLVLPTGFTKENYDPVATWTGKDWSQQISKRVKLQELANKALEEKPRLAADEWSAKHALAIDRMQLLLDNPCSAYSDEASSIPLLDVTPNAPSVKSPSLRDIQSYVDSAMKKAGAEGKSWGDIQDKTLAEALCSEDPNAPPLFTLCTVALTSSKGKAEADFSLWFSETQDSDIQGKASSRKAWAEYAVIPYFDLKLLFKWQGITASNNQIVDLIYTTALTMRIHIKEGKLERYAKAVFRDATTKAIIDGNT